MINEVISETRVPVKIWASSIEDEAREQVKKVANLPFIFKHVAVMPDVHAGKGSTIGTVIATKGAIIPAAVGVDIGCGMCALQLPFKIDFLGGSERLRELRHSIERSIPTGRFGHKEPLPAAIKFLQDSGNPTIDVETRVVKNALCQVGSLGGGNHFIEICHDQEGGAWVMLHSGSRNIGKHLADLHISRAQDIMKKYFIDLPDPELAYLAQGTEEFKAYTHDLNWAQAYAAVNRETMLRRIVKDISYLTGMSTEELWREPINCHHNYTAFENHFGQNVMVTRKGAVSAREGQLGIMPGSMGVKSYIIRGKGNPESFHSCAHGAGRKMSRTKARQAFTIEDLANQTVGVECRKDDGVLDEIPGAYKDIDVVMKDQADLVEALYELKQVICVKG